MPAADRRAKDFFEEVPSPGRARFGHGAVRTGGLDRIPGLRLRGKMEAETKSEISVDLRISGLLC
jgi:hypothetical protein